MNTFFFFWDERKLCIVSVFDTLREGSVDQNLENCVMFKSLNCWKLCKSHFEVDIGERKEIVKGQ